MLGNYSKILDHVIRPVEIFASLHFQTMLFVHYPR